MHSACFSSCLSASLPSFSSLSLSLLSVCCCLACSWLVLPPSLSIPLYPASLSPSLLFPFSFSALYVQWYNMRQSVAICLLGLSALLHGEWLSCSLSLSLYVWVLCMCFYVYVQYVQVHWYMRTQPHSSSCIAEREERRGKGTEREERRGAGIKRDNGEEWSQSLQVRMLFITVVKSNPPVLFNPSSVDVFLSAPAAVS